MKTIDRFDYFLMGLKNEWFKDGYWLKSCLSLFYTDDPQPYLVRRDDEKKQFYYLDEGERVIITGQNDLSKPLLRPGERMTLPAGTVPNYKGELNTSVGILFGNYLLTISPFGERMPYINKPFSPKDVEKELVHRWKRSRHEVNNDEVEGEIFTDEYLVFTEHALHLLNYCQTVIPSVTEKAMRTNPLVEKRRKELYEQYKDDLNNPVVQAIIDEELVKIDKAYLAGDDSMGFFSNKAINNTRRRTNSHFGSPKGLDDKDQEFINRPLKEGIDLTKFNLYVNDAYGGSIGRGLETQDGGVEVKKALRSAANLKAVEDDCGTRYGLPVKMDDNPEKNKIYLGYSFIENGKTQKITNENLERISGKTLTMRSPSHCVSKHSSMCMTCVGPNVARYPGGIAAVNAKPGSIIMLLRMKGMHVSTVSSAKWHKGVIS